MKKNELFDTTFFGKGTAFRGCGKTRQGKKKMWKSAKLVWHSRPRLCARSQKTFLMCEDKYQGATLVVPLSR